MSRIITTALTYVSVRHLIFGIVIAAVAVGASLRFADVPGADPAAPEAAREETRVTLTTAAATTKTNTSEVIGTARAISEATITPERSGRVMAVPVTLGQRVAAGTVIARLENSSERAAVTEAEGAYEAALASAQQSGVSVREAETSLATAAQDAVTAYQRAYTTANDIIRNSIDQFFAQPDGQVPGLRLQGRGFAAELNAERRAFAELLPTWQSDAQTLSVEDALPAALDTAEERTRRVLNMVDMFITILEAQDPRARYSDAELRQLGSTFAAHRSTLLSTIRDIERAETALVSAANALEKAQLGGADSGTSAADAQVKQALGRLQSAQASLAKTILRSPIAGTVNALDVRTGDFVTANAPVATIANNSALEIVAFAGDRSPSLLQVGAEVSIRQGGTARVSAVAPAVSSATGKREVRLVTESQSISAGDTVTLRASSTAPTDAATAQSVRVPLTAVQFTAEDGYVFTVTDGTLTRRDVTLGAISGDTVVVTAGLVADTPFVADARGLQAGDEVVVNEN